MSKPNDARRVSPGRWIAALLVAGAVQTGSAHARVDEQVRLSVSDALSRAVSAHPELDAQAAEIEAREGEARQAGLWSNPSIELEADEIGGDRGGLGDAETTVFLRQTIPLGGDRSRARNAGLAATRVAQQTLRQRRLDLLARTAAAFVEADAAQDRAEVRQELLDLAREAADAITARVEAGRASPIENNRARVLLETARSAATRARLEANAATGELAAILGAPGLEASLGHPQPLFGFNFSEETPQGAIEANARLAVQQAEIARRAAVLRAERAGAIPDVTVGAGMRRYGSSDETAYLASIEIPIPVFDRNQGNIAAAAARETVSLLEADALRRELMREFALNYGRWRRAGEHYESLRTQILPASREAYEASREAYREGELDLLNLLDVQREYFDSRIALIDARSRFAASAIDLDLVTGGRRLVALLEGAPMEDIQ